MIISIIITALLIIYSSWTIYKTIKAKFNGKCDNCSTSHNCSTCSAGDTCQIKQLLDPQNTPLILNKQLNSKPPR